MKKIKYLISIVIILISIIVIIFLLKSNKLDISKSIVTIESTYGGNVNMGTGFVYKVDDKKSYILTNYHVIEESNEINVYDYDKNEFSANIIKYDVYRDLAIIEIQTDTLNPLFLEDNSNLKKDDIIYTICSSVDTGDISKITKGKVVGEIDYLSDIYEFKPIEANIETSLGSSGSPVINSRGKVVGIIFLRDKDNIYKSYFIPVDYILKFINN